MPTSESLVAAAGLGLWAYSRSAFRVEVLAARGCRVRPGLLLLATHRGSGDVPILCGTFYFRGGLWADRRLHLHFGARDDYFERGFLAGYPRALPLPLRRLLYPVNFGPGLERVCVHPVGFAHRMKLAQLLAALPPSASLDPLLPAELAELFRRRAASVGCLPPRTPREALRGVFADILWRTVTEAELHGPALDAIWRMRAAAAEEDLRVLVEVVRAREPLLFFPEGQHSPDGTIGPLVGRGLRRLVREGAPELVQHLAIAYDPLTQGRPRAFLGVGDASLPAREDVEAAVLAGLRRAMPLTCGQVVAHELVAAAGEGRDALGTGAIDAALAAAAREVRAEGRPADPALGDPAGRRRRLRECFTSLRRRRSLESVEPDRILFDASRLSGDATLGWLAREYASAREVGDLPQV